jgi:hypothetical protein
MIKFFEIVHKTFEYKYAGLYFLFYKSRIQLYKNKGIFFTFFYVNKTAFMNHVYEGSRQFQKEEFEDKGYIFLHGILNILEKFVF